MKKQFEFLFKTFVLGWIIYLPYYVLQSFSLWVGVLLLHPPIEITYWQLFGSVMVLRVIRGLIARDGNAAVSAILKEQIAKDAWEHALSLVPGETDKSTSDAEFKEWYKDYKQTISE